MIKKETSSKNFTRHVVPHSQGWATKQGGSDQVTSIYRTKREAEAAAREQSRREGSKLIIHNKEGVIQRQHTYGHTSRSKK